MGFYFEDGFAPYKEETEINKEFLDDMDSQVIFHKEKFTTEDIHLVAEVIKNLMVALVQNLPEDVAKASIPILTGFSEALLELRESNDALRAELIEKNVPPPDDFQSN